MFRHDQSLGGKEGSTTSDAGQKSQRVRLEAMEYGLAIRSTRFVQSLPGPVGHARADSRSCTIGLINLAAKQTGAPSAGNSHAGCEVAGAGNGLTVGLVRHSQRKRGATDRSDLRSTAPVLDPTACSSLGAANRILGRSAGSKK